MTARFDIDRVIGGVALIVLHEVDALSGHGRALVARWRSMWRSRSHLERWREQRSLNRQTARRLHDDRLIRRELWRGLWRDLRR